MLQGFFSLTALLAIVNLSGADPVINGTVRSTSGKIIQSARIEFTDQLSSNRYTTISDLEGTYEIDLIPIITAVTEKSDDLSTPDNSRLQQNYPNPFNSSTIIPYSISIESNIELTIYDVLGRKVRTLVEQRQSAGDYSVQWDGFDGDGKGVAAGIYLYRLITDHYIESKKMLLLDGVKSTRSRIDQNPPRMKTVASRQFSIRVTGIGITDYHIEGIEINESKILDITDVEVLEAVAIITEDLNGDGLADDIEIVDPETRQEIQLQDVDFDGKIDIIEEIQEHVGDSGNLLTQETILAKVGERTIVSGRFIVEDINSGEATINFTAKSENIDLADVAISMNEGELSSTISGLTSEIIEFDERSATILIPKSMASHIDQITFRGRPDITVIDEDPLIVWSFYSVAEEFSELKNMNVTVEDNSVHLYVQVKSIDSITSDNFEITFNGNRDGWDHKIYEENERSFKSGLKNTIIEAYFENPGAGTHEIKLTLTDDSVEQDSKSKFIVIFEDGVPSGEDKPDTIDQIWNELSLPVGLPVQEILSDNQSIRYYARVRDSHSFWRKYHTYTSNNAGDQWLGWDDGRSSFIFENNISAIDPNNPNRLYSRNGPLSVSTDGGESWEQVNIPGNSESILWDVEFSASNPDIIYASNLASFYQSVDSGLRWNKILDGSYHGLNVDLHESYILHSYSRLHLHISHDEGQSWRRIIGGWGNDYFADLKFDPFFTEIIYATPANSSDIGLYQSLNRGEDWQNIHPDPSHMYVVGIFPLRDELWTFVSDASSSSGGNIKAYRTKSNKISWSEISPPLGEVFSSAVEVGPINQREVIIGTTHGMFKTKDDGNSWISQNKGIAGVLIRNIFTNPKNPSQVWATAIDRRYETNTRYLFLSNDHGLTWSILNRPGEGFIYGITLGSNTTNQEIYACTSNGLYLSTDDGTTWNKLNPIQITQDLIVSDTEPTRLIGISQSSAVISTDGGMSWRTLYSGEVKALRTNYNDQGLLYQLIYDSDRDISEVFISNDMGENWNTSGYEFKGRAWDLEIDPHNSEQLYVIANSGVMVSADKGATWQIVSEAVRDIMISPNKPSNIVALGQEILLSQDFGETWSPIQDGLRATTRANGEVSKLYSPSSFAINSIGSKTILYMGLFHENPGFENTGIWHIIF